MRAIVPINDINRRAPEAGRIRLGEQTAKAMRAIDTFRFTSQHQDAIERIASLYGGTVSVFDNPKARIKGWQVKTDSKKIEVLLPAGGLSTWYELWSGGGCLRRCDGITVETPTSGPDGSEMESSPCICMRKQIAECKPKTRLNVILPQLAFAGTWRLETSGWNAAQELPGMFEMISHFTAQGAMVKAHLHLEPRTTTTNGKKKNFVVPTLSVDASVTELLAGSGTAQAQLEAPAMPVDEQEHVQLTRGVSVPDVAGDDEIVDAEIIDDDEDLRVEELARNLAAAARIDPDAFVTGLWSDTDGDLSKIRTALGKMADGKIIPNLDGGKLSWDVQ